jgi:hypothetical protein
MNPNHGKDVSMTRRRFMILLATVVALNSFFWLATTGLALPQAVINQFFGPKMIRAEVIVQAVGGAQDWRIDRGVVTAVNGSTVTLREADGTIVTVEVSPIARVQGARQLRPRMRVVLYHQANQPADVVQVEGPNR